MFRFFEIYCNSSDHPGKEIQHAAEGRDMQIAKALSVLALVGDRPLEASESALAEL